MSHHKLTVYDDIPARALQEAQGAWLGEHCGRESQALGAQQDRSGMDTQSSPLPGWHLLDSVVKGSLKGTDPKSPSELGSVEMSLGTQRRSLTSQRSHNEAEDLLWSDQQADRPRGGTLTWGWNCRLRPLEVGKPYPSCLSAQAAPF